MKHTRSPSRTVRFPPGHRLYVDYMERARRCHVLHGIFKTDVTGFLEYRERCKAESREPPSLTGYVARALALVVDEDKTLQAVRRGSRLILFDQVDVSMTVARRFGSERAATGYVLRSANRKTLGEIHREIRSVQDRPAEDDPEIARSARFGRLPGLLRRLVYWWMGRNPELRKQAWGTVGLSGLGTLAGMGAYWALPLTPLTLTLVIGGIEWQPLLAPDGGIRRAAQLSLTLSVDHDIVNGALAVRFYHRLKGVIEGDVLLGEFL